MVRAEIELREENAGLGACLLQDDAGFQTADQRDGVAPLADLAVVDRGEEIDLRAGCEDRTEVEAPGQDADNCDALAVEVHGCAHDVGIGMKLALPERITQQGHGGSALQGVGLVEEVPEGRWNTQHLKEVMRDHDAGGGTGFAATRELDVVCGGEGEVAGNVGIGAVTLEQLLPCVDGVGCAGPVAREDGGADLSRRWASRKGSGRSINVSTTLKTA